MKMNDTKKYKAICYWLQDFRENLVDERSPLKPWGDPAPKDRDASSSSHELPMEPRAKVEPGSGSHCLHAFFGEPKLQHLLEDKTRVSCRRRAATVVPRAENLGDLMTTDHGIRSEEK